MQLRSSLSACLLVFTALGQPTAAVRDTDLKVFNNVKYGYTLRYPSDWYSQIISGMFSIVSFLPSTAMRGTGLAENGAGIYILTAAQAVRERIPSPRSLEELVTILTSGEHVIERKRVDIRDGEHSIKAIQTKSTCCDSSQESVYLYFSINDRLFVGTVYYWRGDPNAGRFLATLKQIVLSLRVTASRAPSARRNPTR